MSPFLFNYYTMFLIFKKEKVSISENSYQHTPEEKEKPRGQSFRTNQQGFRYNCLLTYCTDTRPVPVIAEYAAGSDLFICEGMYGEKEKASKAREYKHMTFYEAAALAKEAKPGQLWLTHYSPSLTRPDDYMDEVRKIFPRAKAARDGWTMELEFDEE